MLWKCLSIVLALSALLSQPLSASEEKFDADFLQQLTAAEVDGIGESFVAYSIGASALNNNPAGLSYAKENELLVNAHSMPRIVAVIMKEGDDGRWEDYGRYTVEPTDMGTISYALPLSRFGSLGFGCVFHYGGRFIRVDKTGKAVSAFPRDDLSFIVGYSVKILQNFSIGVDIKSIRSKISVDDGSSIGHASAVNAGFMHQIGERVRVGAVLQNMGGEISFSDPELSRSLRKRLLIGAKYTVKDTGNSVLSVAMDANPPFEDGPRYSFGAELLYAQRLALRIGYVRNTETYYDSLLNLHDGSSIHEERTWIRKGLTIGAGVTLGKVDINFARAPRREPALDDDEKLRLEKHDSIISFSCTARF